MTPWDNKRFKRLEEVVIATMQGKRPGLDVPYYCFPYDPSEELIALDMFSNFVKRLQAKGLSAEQIWISDLMIKALEELGFLRPKAIKIEFENRDIIESDLKRNMPEKIARSLKEKLSGKDVSHCSVLLRCGALYPFVHVSDLCKFIAGVVKCTLVVPYPGGREGNMLNDKGWGKKYYRLKVI